MAGKLKPKAKPAPAPPRMRETPLTRLKRKGLLNVFELQAADEIQAAHAMSIGAQVSRDADLGLPAGEPRPDAADNAAARRSDLLKSWQRWRVDLKGTVPGKCTTAILIDDTSWNALDAYNQWRKGTAIKHLIVGLRHYAALRGNVPNGVGAEWKVKV